MACAQFIPYPSGWSGYNSLCMGIRGLGTGKPVNPTQKCGNYIFLRKIDMYMTFLRETPIYTPCIVVRVHTSHKKCFLKNPEEV
jgi:hypothetical protein